MRFVLDEPSIKVSQTAVCTNLPANIQVEPREGKRFKKLICGWPFTAGVPTGNGLGAKNTSGLSTGWRMFMKA
jgi:hypothetical protein